MRTNNQGTRWQHDDLCADLVVNTGPGQRSAWLGLAWLGLAPNWTTENLAVTLELGRGGEGGGRRKSNSNYIWPPIGQIWRPTLEHYLLHLTVIRPEIACTQLRNRIELD